MENEKHGKPISKDEFEKMRKAYQEKNPKKTHAVLFHQESIKRVLDTPGAVGIRIHFGINEDGDDTVMLSASDANGVTLYSSLEDRGQLCPPYC
ncbi:MAG TPA: hypothetical protein VIM65_19840 [Cyclobacteriaceae bacterium]